MLRNLVLELFHSPTIYRDENKARKHNRAVGVRLKKDKIETNRWEPTQQKTLLPVRQWSNYRPLGKSVD